MGVSYSLISSTGISTVVRSSQLRFSTKAELEAAHCVVDSPPPCRRQDMRATLALSSQFYSRLFCAHFQVYCKLHVNVSVVSLKNLSFFDNGTKRAAWVNDVEESVNVRMLSRVSAHMSHPSHFISFVLDVVLSCSLCWSLGHRDTIWYFTLSDLLSKDGFTALNHSRAHAGTRTRSHIHTLAHADTHMRTRAYTHAHVQLLTHSEQWHTAYYRCESSMCSA